MIGIIDPETGEPITLTEYSKATGIPYNTLNNRIRYGLSDDLIGFEGDLRKMSCRDHKGNEYESLTEMAKAYGMNLRTLFMRINRWGIDNIEKCLTEPVRKKPAPEECRCVDPNGKEWSSETKMCRGWHCGYRQFKRKQAAGLPLAECLDGKRAVLTDPKGREFYSWTDMANAWGIDMHTLMMRTRTYHWSLGKALTAPLKRKCRKMTDCEGREFETLTAFCKFWGVAKKTVRKRLALGMDMKDVLKDSTRMKILRKAGGS